MALTFTKDRDPVVGSQRSWQGQIDFDNSYPTGGEAIAASDFGLSKIENVIITQSTVSHRVLWDSANSKLMVVTDSLGTQLAGSGDASSVSAEVVVLGY